MSSKWEIEGIGVLSIDAAQRKQRARPGGASATATRPSAGVVLRVPCLARNTSQEIRCRGRSLGKAKAWTAGRGNVAEKKAA